MREGRGVGWIAEVVRTRTTGVRIVHGRRGLRVPRAIALTFDDGPSTEWTPPILDVLAAHGARGTFFVLGASVEGRESILRRAVSDGHELGNHGFSHADPTTLDEQALLEELERTNRLVVGATGIHPRLYRPAFADRDVRVARVAQSIGLTPTVLRSIDPADWRERNPERVAGAVLDGLHPGGIVCLHDAIPPQEPRGAPDRVATVAALPLILNGLEAKGYDAITVTELLT